MKKLGIFFGILFSLWMATILFIPLLVNVDRYRPQLTAVANQHLNGTLELGKLSLSLLGHVYVEVGGVHLSDSNHKEIVAVNEAYFQIPFFSILVGSPEITFEMKEPFISLVKNKDGKLNITGLSKESSTQSSAAPAVPPSSTTAQSNEASAMPGNIPGILARARLGVELKNAKLNYIDEVSGINTQVKDFNIVLKDISLSHPIELEAWADLDTQLGKSFSLKGPVRLTGRAETELKDGKIERASLSASVNLDDLELVSPGLFEKKKGVAAHGEVALNGNGKEIKIDKVQFQFLNAEVNALGNVTQLGQGLPSSPVVNLSFKTNEIEFKPWSDLLPSLKNYDLGGTARFEAEARGPSQKLGYQANLTFNGVTVKTSALKAPASLDGVIHIVTDQVDRLLITLKAPGTYLKLQGKVVSLSKPQITLDLTSPGMDLDQWIEGQPEWEQEHLVAWLFGAFAVLAMALAATGLYSVVSFSVAQRTNEFGIRMALGARPGDVLRVVFGSAVVSVGSGLAAGILLTLALNNVLASWAEGSSRDVVVLLSATALLCIVAGAACAAPAYRASSVDPMTALRYE